MKRLVLRSAGRRASGCVVAVAAVAGMGIVGAVPAQAATLTTTQVQWDLAGMGYLPNGYSAVDGLYGPNTTTAVSQFQSDDCLSVDGVAGANTDAALQQQARLVQAKVGVSQDGYFGPATESAIRSYQSSHHLSVDGVAGPATMASMGISRYGSCHQTTSMTTTNIQWDLAGMGYLSGGFSSVDGVYGANTTAAVRQFQTDNCLTVDGVAGHDTDAALMSKVKQIQQKAGTTADGYFGANSEAAVKSFQSAHGLTADGVVGAKTMAVMGIQRTGSCQAPTPTPPSPGTSMWGIDTFAYASQSFINQVTDQYGKPQFWGRYLVNTSASELNLLHSNGIKMLVISNEDGGSALGYAAGHQRGLNAIAKAKSDGIGTGTAIYYDIEANIQVNSDFIRGWYDAVNAGGYVPGYYANPRPGSSSFDGAYCSAVSSNSAIGTRTLIYSSEPEPGATTRSGAPAFRPSVPSCTARVAAWQYDESAMNGNIDEDETGSINAGLA